MKYDFLVYIGRFQPLHRAHEEIIQRALSISNKVIVVLGSAKQSRSCRNPFTEREREEMIMRAFRGKTKTPNQLIVTSVSDQRNNNVAWVRSIQSAVKGYTWDTVSPNPKIGIIGHSKDESSFYLNMFPQWDYVPVENIDEINGTDIRKSIFIAGEIPEDLISARVADYLDSLLFEDGKPTTLHDHMSEEFYKVEEYKAAWKNSPYEPTFITTDAVLIQGGHILLIERKFAPGRGLLALPGGYLNPKETLEDCMIRELREETRVKIPEPVLRGSITKRAVFDDPNRDDRGRIITHTFLIEPNNSANLPKVKADDDAYRAFWMPLCDIEPEMMAFDHFEIIKYMIGTES